MRIVHRKREGAVVALFVLLLPALLGMVALVIDLGIMLAMRRQAQSAADSGALAAASDLLAGSAGTMAATAQATIGSSSNLSTAQVQVNSPPSMGKFAGNSQYVEVFVTIPISTFFIQVLSDTSTYYVSARAVAGISSVAPHELITCLAPYTVPGLSIDGIAVEVDGTVAVNSQGSGVDQNNASVNYGLGQYAVTLPNSGTLASNNLRVVGGVDNPGSITALKSSNPALSARLLPRTDPFLNLPTPTTANGVVAVYPDANGDDQGSPTDIALTLNNGQSFNLSPGIYSSIEITGAGPGTVTFQPGMYVFQGGNSAGHALWIDTGGTIMASGVLFYSTAGSYDPTTGKPDINDGNTLGTESGAVFGSVQIMAGSLTLTGLTGSSSLQGMVYFQRRWNTQAVSIYSGTSSTQIAGTLYARWARASLSMSGNWQGQIVAGCASINGLTSNSTATISKGSTYATSPLVFLVE
jgi:Flp pilus assembly protein TadG